MYVYPEIKAYIVPFAPPIASRAIAITLFEPIAFIPTPFVEEIVIGSPATIEPFSLFTLIGTLPDIAIGYCPRPTSLSPGARPRIKPGAVATTPTSCASVAFEALVTGYKTLYPVKKTIKGWRGDDIEIDWLYMLQENFNLAKMLRSEDEKPTNIKEVLTKLKVNYE